MASLKGGAESEDEGEEMERVGEERWLWIVRRKGEVKGDQTFELRQLWRF